jgi:K+-sensing histidine kinase KdpD
VKAVLSRADDPVVRGAEVLDATTLAAAREHLNSQDVDLILLDNAAKYAPSASTIIFRAKKAEGAVRL